MLVEEAVDFSTGFGETDLSVCLRSEERRVGKEC